MSQGGLEELRLRWVLVCARARRDDVLEALDRGLEELARRDRQRAPHPQSLAAMVEYTTEQVSDPGLTMALLRPVHTYGINSGEADVSTPIAIGYMSAIVRDRPTQPTAEHERVSEADLLQAAEGKKPGSGGNRMKLLLVALIVVLIAGAAAYFLLVAR